MAGDYHSGPFSVLIPFGVWGAIGWLWFLGASCRALYFNYRYGDESLRAANTLLLAYFGARTISFFVIFGDLSADLAQFVAVTGMSVCLNGGIRKPTKASEIIASDPSIPGTL